MAAKQQILFHLFMATVAVIILKTTVACEHRPEQDGPPNENHHHNHSAAGNNTDDSERKFGWPSSVGITIHREGKVDGPAGEHMGLNEPPNNHSNAPENDTGDGKRKIPFQFPLPIRASPVGPDGVQHVGLNEPIKASGNDNDGERKIHWPSSVTIGFHRSGRIDSDDAQYMDPNGANNDPHSAPRNNTDGERKIHWPSSATLTINRSGRIHSDDAQYMGPNGANNHPHNTPGNNTDGERKIHWPSSATLTIHRSGRVDSDNTQDMGPNGPNDHPHNAPGNDTDAERKFHWPSSMSITINRAGQAIHHDPKQPEFYNLDQEERLYGLVPVLVSCNHTTQAGRTCADCTHSLLCFSNNLGIKRDCGPQYCDDGRCTPQPSANCNATSNA